MHINANIVMKYLIMNKTFLSEYFSMFFLSLIIYIYIYIDR